MPSLVTFRRIANKKTVCAVLLPAALATADAADPAVTTDDADTRRLFGRDFGTTHTTFADGAIIKGEGWQYERQSEDVTCQNDDGHGFIINRAEQKPF